LRKGDIWLAPVAGVPDERSGTEAIVIWTIWLAGSLVAIAIAWDEMRVRKSNRRGIIGDHPGDAVSLQTAGGCGAAAG
jgi:hypothetical protein